MGKRSPIGYDDGEIVGTTKDLHFVDIDPLVGEAVFYSVYSFLGTQVNINGPSIFAGVHVDEVHNLKALRSSPDEIQLLWQLPPKVSELTIRKGPDLHSINRFKGKLVTIDDIYSGTIDNNVSFKEHIFYLIFCSYSFPPIKYHSPGLHIHVFPHTYSPLPLVKQTVKQVILCPYCQFPLTFGDEKTVNCKICHAPHHLSCWIKNKSKCSVPFCG